MSGGERSESQRAKHLEEIARRYLKGETQTAIALSLSIDQSTVSRDLKYLRSLWLESAIRDFDEHKAEQLAKIDALEAEYWKAWERSLQTRETVSNESGDNASGSWNKTVTKREALLGIPAYLAGAERCIAERCKLLGLYAPVKTEIAAEGLSPERIELIQSKILGIGQ